MKFAKADFCSGLALGALGIYIIAQALQWEYLGADGPGPGFFPLWYGIAMAALSAVLVVSSALRAAPRGAPPATSADWRRVGRALAAWLALALAVAAFKLLGFVLSFAALTFFMVAVMYRRPVVLAASVAVTMGAAFYLVFPIALGVALPVGIFGF